ncbi:Ca-activated chloride channel family protein [Oceanobacillus limi]|uniref:Ca-activated chloride channel family protein n=1 Tax=Oceanobacillus limi TaxID=930131 RepID=A0A1I0DMZ1_9BACI|nr:VWA domain-containing protein [Oceanobacillus limi]SET33883.1 Ca-activated chloride channel family protein [Oceanobacillus limi]
MKHGMIVTLMTWIIIIFTLSGCSFFEHDELPENEDLKEVNDDESSVVEKVIDDENSNDSYLNEEEFEEEPVEDLLANLLETAPELPTNVEEVVEYPTGPLAGNGRHNGQEPIMSTDEMVEFVEETLPPIPEDADEAYLNDWFKAYRFLFAESYPDPNQILTSIKFNQYGHPEMEDERFQFKDQMNVLIILDVSGSMANMMDGSTMMDIAKNSIREFTSTLPEEANVGLRVYGHEGKRTEKTKEESCELTELVYDIQPLESSRFSQIIDPFEPTGWTPIALSLEEAKKDFEAFPGAENTNLVYVVSDGAETCGGDPVRVAEELTESDIQPIINVIGFNVDMDGQSHLREIAEAGGGLYTDAGNEDQLNEAFEQANELLKQWRSWKINSKREATNQRIAQNLDAGKFRVNWNNYLRDEDIIMHRVLLELDQKYLGGHFHNLNNKRSDLWHLIKGLGKESEEYLLEEIENNYSEIMEEINQEFDENVDDN